MTDAGTPLTERELQTLACLTEQELLRDEFQALHHLRARYEALERETARLRKKNEQMARFIQQSRPEGERDE